MLPRNAASGRGPYFTLQPVKSAITYFFSRTSSSFSVTAALHSPNPARYLSIAIGQIAFRLCCPPSPADALSFLWQPRSTTSLTFVHLSDFRLLACTIILLNLLHFAYAARSAKLPQTIQEQHVLTLATTPHL